jgi:hypothetical protein
MQEKPFHTGPSQLLVWRQAGGAAWDGAHREAQEGKKIKVAPGQSYTIDAKQIDR